MEATAHLITLGLLALARLLRRVRVSPPPPPLPPVVRLIVSRTQHDPCNETVRLSCAGTRSTYTSTAPAPSIASNALKLATKENLEYEYNHAPAARKAPRHYQTRRTRVRVNVPSR